MTLTLTATAEPTHVPPRVKLEATQSDATKLIKKCVLFRNGAELRFDPAITGSTALAYDYDASFDALLTYRADVTETGIVQAFAEVWTNTAAWTGSGWAAAAGVVSSSTGNAVIYRDAGGTIAKVSVVSPSNFTLQLTDSANVVLASVKMGLDGNVTLTGSAASSIVAGTGAYTVTVAGSSVTVTGSGWSTSVSFAGTATRVRLLNTTAPITTSWSSSIRAIGGAAIDSSGNVYVAYDSSSDDAGFGKVDKYSAAGALITSWDTVPGGGAGAPEPLGIAIDSSGNVWISAQNNRIYKYSSTGTPITNFGGTGTGNGQFSTPRGLAFDSSNNLYVVDRGNSRIQKFNSSGTYVTQWGTAGSGDGQFNSPAAVTVDSTNAVYVTDTGNSRVQKFTNTGTFTTKWGTSGTGNGQFTLPQGITRTSTDHIVVADLYQSGTDMIYRLQEFSSTGTWISAAIILTHDYLSYDSWTDWNMLTVDATDHIFAVLHRPHVIQKVTLSPPASVDDITVYRISDSLAESATGTATLSPTGSMAGVWMTNAAEPSLAALIDDGTDTGGPYYIELSTRETTELDENTTQLEIEGSADVVTVVNGPRKREKWTLDISCETEAARDGLLSIFANSSPINLRIPPALAYLGLDAGFYSVGKVSTKRDEGPKVSERATVSCPLTPQREPAFQPLWYWTCDTVAQTYATCDAVLAAYASCDDLLVGPTG